MTRSVMQKLFLYLALLQSIVATLGSLYFSEVMKLPPCVLCWYQRIAIYPLIPILLVGLWRKDPGVAWYALPLTTIGLGISIYHNLLYWKILPESAAPCVAGISCTTKYFEWFGFITIPLMALVALIVLNGCLIGYLWLQKNLSNDA